jgi:hypothetical protein
MTGEQPLRERLKAVVARRRAEERESEAQAKRRLAPRVTRGETQETEELSEQRRLQRDLENRKAQSARRRAEEEVAQALEAAAAERRAAQRSQRRRRYDEFVRVTDQSPTIEQPTREIEVNDVPARPIVPEELIARRQQEAQIAKGSEDAAAQRRAAARSRRRRQYVESIRVIEASPTIEPAREIEVVIDEALIARRRQEVRISKDFEEAAAQRRAAARSERRRQYAESLRVAQASATIEPAREIEEAVDEELIARRQAEARATEDREAASLQRRAQVRLQRRLRFVESLRERPKPAQPPRAAAKAPPAAAKASPAAANAPAPPARTPTAPRPVSADRPTPKSASTRVLTRAARPLKLSRLQTNGAFVVDENGVAVSFRGLAVDSADALNEAALTAAVKLWNVNLVRLPIAPAAIVSETESSSPDDFLGPVDRLIGKLAERGIYTLIAMEPPIAPDVTNAVIDSDIFFAWEVVAQRYLRTPSVLYETLSTPAAATGDWLQAMQILIGWIRTVDPAATLFVGNGTAAPDVTALPILFSTGDPAPNLVYTIRVGPGQQPPSDESAGLTALAASFPVVATYWANFSPSGLDRSSELTAEAFSRLGIGWVAAGWNSEPRLVANAMTSDFTPTKWGLVVQRAAALPTKEPLAPLLPD